MEFLQYNPEARETLNQLVRRYPDTPFLALGQTIFWDEPTKACFVRFLQECCPDIVFWHGIHDTDYFSRLPRPLSGARPYAVVEHNDTTTGGLWVAMCEASRLFGAETVVSKATLRQYGCNLHKALAADGSLSEDGVTAAWGWKGIVSTGEREWVARDVLLADLAEELLSLIHEALYESIEALVDTHVQQSAQGMAKEILSRAKEYIDRHPAVTLTQLYQYLLPLFYEFLLGERPGNLKLTSSAQIFCFSPETAGRPLFRPLAIFLDPRTRTAAVRAYNDAVAGSGIYTLDHFGEGAIPFDLVVPGLGRGTISLFSREIVIHTPEPISIRVSEPVDSTQSLARAIAGKLGEDCAIVGKAVMLIPMIAQEYILVFHEGASAYTEHTHEFIVSMEREGVSLDCRPILRLHYRTWESLGATDVELSLPEHLAEAFGRSEITGREFGARWQQVRVQQQELLNRLNQARKPAALLELLAECSALRPTQSENAAIWRRNLSEYRSARETLRANGSKISQLQQETNALRSEVYRLRQQIQVLEREKGKHFHDVIYPLQMAGAPLDSELAHRRDIEQRIIDIRATIADLRVRMATIRRSQDELAVDPEMVAARRMVIDHEGHAEVERLRLTRNALLTIRGLELTNRRPTGWWFPLVSPDGAWFRRLAETCVLESESLCHMPNAQGASS